MKKEKKKIIYVQDAIRDYIKDNLSVKVRVTTLGELTSVINSKCKIVNVEMFLDGELISSSKDVIV